MTRVLIPVFNAAAQLADCLAALTASIPEQTPITVIDDASSDPEIARLLAQFAASRATVEVLANPVNLGFIGSVNRGFARTSGDLLLLNSDTVPTHGFLGRIEQCADSDARIATVTPFSNNAEICSFPDFCVANPLPADPAAIARAFAEEEDAAVEPLPMDGAMSSARAPTSAMSAMPHSRRPVSAPGARTCGACRRAIPATMTTSPNSSRATRWPMCARGSPAA